jgi:uncharacterized phage protein gp47/JayE
MPFTRPSLQQIIERILADISLKLGERSSILRRAWTRVWAIVFAGAVHMLYGFIDWVKDQFFIDSADDEYVIKEADFYGIIRGAAEFAYGIIDVTGVPGAPLPAGSVFVNSAGTRYITQALVEMTGSPVEVSVKCAEVGIKGNMVAGSALELESPIAGIESLAEVNADDPIELGADLETMDSLKARLSSRMKNPPQGGSRDDYETWAREESGLGEVAVYTPGEISSNPFIPPHGHVYVYFSEQGSTDTPSPAKVAAVKAKIVAKMPVTARVEVFGIEFVPITFVIEATPSLGFTFDQMVSDIQAELVDLFSDSAKPYAVLSLANINEAISRPISEQTHILTTPSSDVEFGYNQMGVVVTPITVTAL